MPTYDISASLAADNDATVVESQSGIAAAYLAASNAATVAEVQACLAAASLAQGAAMGACVAMDFYFIKAMIDGLVDDPLPLLAALLACEAASTCEFQIGDVLEKIIGDAYSLSDELWGLRLVRRSIVHRMTRLPN